MKKKLITLSGVLLSMPALVFAQTTVANTCAQAATAGTIESVICEIGRILNTIIPFLIVLGVLYFVWGVITYVVGGDEEAKAQGRSRIIYGIIGLVVIVGMWGLVRIVVTTFGLGGTTPINIPCIQGTPGC